MGRISHDYQSILSKSGGTASGAAPCLRWRQTRRVRPDCLRIHRYATGVRPAVCGPGAPGPIRPSGPAAGHGIPLRRHAGRHALHHFAVWVVGRYALGWRVEEDIALLVGVGTALFAGVLWLLHRTFVQQVALFAALVITVTAAAIHLQGNQPAPSGFALWGWALCGWRSVGEACFNLSVRCTGTGIALVVAALRTTRRRKRVPSARALRDRAGNRPVAIGLACGGALLATLAALFMGLTK